jgi:hypothetical protein
VPEGNESHSKLSYKADGPDYFKDLFVVAVNVYQITMWASEKLTHLRVFSKEKPAL